MLTATAGSRGRWRYLMMGNQQTPAGLLAASNAFADEGMHEQAVELALEALGQCGDDGTRVSLHERISISGFYGNAERHIAGKESCEILAVDRSLPWSTRNLARQNSTFYARSLKDIMPSAAIVRTEFTPLDGYNPMNPSISRNGNELWMIQRTVNYVIRDDGSYDMRGDSAIRTRNHLLRLSDDLSVMSSEEILPPSDLPPPLYDRVIGWEDCRLFFWKGEPWCTATVRELNREGWCEIVLSRIAGAGTGNCHLADHRVITPNFVQERQHEKNWIPMVVGDNLYFLYSSDPARIIDHHGNLVSTKQTGMAADSFRGGGPLIEMDGGWLALIHESHGMFDGRRRYMHRFVWYDTIGRLSRHTEAFYISKLGIEFAAGIARNPTTGDMVISFGLNDRESWMASVDPNDIRGCLRASGPVTERLADDMYTLSLINDQVNRPLSDISMVDCFCNIAIRSGLPLHADAPKNWDNLLAVYHATMTADSNLPVMDVAATLESAFLPSLSMMGYQKLVSINLDEPNPRIADGIEYRQGDCAGTNFPDGHFGFIACLSVVEHGVDIAKFLAESSRILRKGGHLMVSTDYWHDAVDTHGQMAFGSPVKVFTAQDMNDMVTMAQTNGLEIRSPLRLQCNDKVVSWIGMEYTFINVLFEKVR